MPLATCELSGRNRSLKIKLHLKRWPSAKQKEVLEKSLCNHLQAEFKKEKLAEVTLQPLEQLRFQSNQLILLLSPPSLAYVRTDLKPGLSRQLHETFEQLKGISQSVLGKLEKKYAKSGFQLGSYEEVKKRNQGQEPSQIFYSHHLGFANLRLDAFYSGASGEKDQLSLESKNAFYEAFIPLKLPKETAYPRFLWEHLYPSSFEAVSQLLSAEGVTLALAEDMKEEPWEHEILERLANWKAFRSYAPKIGALLKSKGIRKWTISRRDYTNKIAGTELRTQESLTWNEQSLIQKINELPH
jgi:hypothetical protein